MMHPDFLTGVSSVLPFKDFQDIESHLGSKTSAIKRYIVAVVVVASIMTNPTLQRKQSDWSIKVEIRSDYCRGKFALLDGRGLGGDVSLFISTWLHFSVRFWFNLSVLQSLFANVMSAAVPKSASRVAYSRAKGELQFARWRHFTTTTKGLQFVAFIGLFAYCMKPLFQCEAKLLIWEWSFIIMQIKIMFTTKVLY